MPPAVPQHTLAPGAGTTAGAPAKSTVLRTTTRRSITRRIEAEPPRGLLLPRARGAL
jgi:hypothetical protein